MGRGEIVLYLIVLYSTVLYGTVLYGTVLYGTVLYYIVLYCIVLYFISSNSLKPIVRSSVRPAKSPLGPKSLSIAAK